MHLSFVLLPAARHARGAQIVDAFARIFPEQQRPLGVEATSEHEMAELRSHDGSITYVAPMPAPVPNGEAEAAVGRSMAAFARGFTPPAPHAAHFIVTTQGSILDHTRLVAATAAAYDAVAIYEGNAGATHPTAFYLDVVTSGARPLMVWTGISMAQQDNRRSILTLGLQNVLGIPDMLVSGGPGKANEALIFAFDMAGYVLDRGTPLPEGDTVGRTAEEKIRVRYVPSPLDPGRNVVKLDLP